MTPTETRSFLLLAREDLAVVAKLVDEIYTREAERWLFTEIDGLESIIKLDPPGVEFSLAEIYAGLDEVLSEEV